MTSFIQIGEYNLNLLKGGVKIDYRDMVAFTKDGFIVPLGHPEGFVFAGFSGGRGSPDPVDNTNGQDGDISIGIGNNRETPYFFASDLTKELNVKIENLRQPIYASSPNTLYTTPGAGRMAIGTLASIRKNLNLDETRDPNEIVYELNFNTIPPIYR